MSVALALCVFAVFVAAEPVVSGACADSTFVACGTVGGRFSLITLARALGGVPLLLAWRHNARSPVPLIGRSGVAVVGSPLVGWCAVFVFVQGLLPESHFVREVYDSAAPAWLLWVAMLVAAPLFEELLFRGVLLDSFVFDSFGRWSRPVAAVASALLWAAVHAQYSYLETSVVFVLGVFLAWSRYAYAAMAAPLVAHSLWNFAALILLFAR